MWQSHLLLPNPVGSRWGVLAEDVKASINALEPVPMMVRTNLSAGLDEAVEALLDPDVGSFSSKVVILMTDGQWNVGRDPIEAAKDARDAGIAVHTVSMLTGYQPDLATIAEITGGKY